MRTLIITLVLMLSFSHTYILIQPSAFSTPTTLDAETEPHPVKDQGKDPANFSPAYLHFMDAFFYIKQPSDIVTMIALGFFTSLFKPPITD